MVKGNYFTTSSAMLCFGLSWSLHFEKWAHLRLWQLFLFFLSRSLQRKTKFSFYFFICFYYLTKVNWFPSCVFRDFSIYSSISTSILRRQPEITPEVCLKLQYVPPFLSCRTERNLWIFNCRLLKTKAHVWFAGS